MEKSRKEQAGKKELEIFKGDLQFPRWGTGCDMMNPAPGYH